MTSKTTWLGLPTTYPISVTQKNGLTDKSYALVHQICTVDGNSFKDSAGNWLERMGQLSKKDRAAISEQLQYFLAWNNEPSEDWFQQNATPSLVKKIYGYLPNTEKDSLLESLIEASD